MATLKGNRARKTAVRRADLERRVRLSETLDRVLNKGVVVVGDLIVSVAGIDLVYVGVNLILCSVETMRQASIEPRFTVRSGVAPAARLGS